MLFAHGSRDAEWSIPFRNIQRKVASRCPEVAVEVAYLGRTPPALEETLERLVGSGHRHIIIAPLFMAQGGHLKEDLPQLLAALRERHPGISLELLPPVGEVESVLEAISAWLADAAQRQPGSA